MRLLQSLKLTTLVSVAALVVACGGSDGPGAYVNDGNAVGPGNLDENGNPIAIPLEKSKGQTLMKLTPDVAEALKKANKGAPLTLKVVGRDGQSYDIASSGEGIYKRAVEGSGQNMTQYHVDEKGNATFFGIYNGPTLSDNDPNKKYWDMFAAGDTNATPNRTGKVNYQGVAVAARDKKFGDSTRNNLVEGHVNVDIDFGKGTPKINDQTSKIDLGAGQVINIPDMQFEDGRFYQANSKDLFMEMQFTGEKADGLIGTWEELDGKLGDKSIGAFQATEGSKVYDNKK